MTGTREQEIQHHNPAAPHKLHDVAKPDLHPCGGCSACHQMTGIQASSRAMDLPGGGVAGSAMQRSCATTFFQRNLGNSYLQSENSGSRPAIQRKCNCGGSCESCSGKEDETGKIQAKLAIGSPDDEYEQEADRVADQVMRMTEPSPQSADNVAGNGMNIQRISESGGSAGTSGEGIDLDQSGGEPLSSSTRRFMEPRFGADFSGVRLHADGNAHNTAAQIQARAFTYGNHVWLGKGESEGDRNLMAHELTHVIQQSGAADRGLVPEEETEDADIGIEMHNLGNVGNVSRQTPPILESGLKVQRAACPCCTDSISISNISRIDNATHMGHSFDVLMDMSYPTSGPSGSCTLEWWEKTNVPYTAGMSPNTWTNMFALLPNSPTLAPWVNRAENCGTSSPVTITDPPSLGKRPGRTVNRTLEFRIVINSMPQSSESGCAATSQQVTAKQELSMVNGAPDWSASSFTTP